MLAQRRVDHEVARALSLRNAQRRLRRKEGVPVRREELDTSYARSEPGVIADIADERSGFGALV